MTSETPELLACPFCGSHDLTPTSQGGDSHWIMCISCKAEGPWAGAADDARTLWDRRAFPSSPPIKASVSDEAVEAAMTSLFGEYTNPGNKHAWITPDWVQAKTKLRAALVAIAQALQSARLQGLEEASEFAWLVESFSGQHENYLAGFEERYAGMGFAWFPVWTKEHSKALRLSRKADADAVASSLSNTSKAKAVEHAWHDPVPAQPTTQEERDK